MIARRILSEDPRSILRSAHTPRCFGNAKQIATFVMVATEVVSRLSILQGVIAEFGIKGFNPTPIWKAIRDLFNVNLADDAAFVSLVQRNGGSWIVVKAEDGTAYSFVVDASSMPKDVDPSAVADWHLCVVEATRTVEDYKITALEKRLRAYPVFEA